MTTRSSAGDYVTEMVATVERTASELRTLSEPAVSARPAPGKWSIKEIIGHLIDSASNNHQRFVRAQWSDELICATYDQDAWVATQDYQVPADRPVTLDYFMRDYVEHMKHHLAQIAALRESALPG